MKSWFFILFAFLFSSCGRDEKIEVYQIPKEKLESMPFPENHPDVSNRTTETQSVQKKSLRWKIPAGWKEKPAGNMRIASFTAHGQNGEADISIVTLPGEAGGLLANVNRWRGQLELPPLVEKNLSEPGILEKKTFSGQEMTLVDFESIPAPGAIKKRMVVALFLRNGVSWFFKLTGDSNTVNEVKSTFLKF